MKGAGAMGAPPERGASSRLFQPTSQDETPVKDARYPQNAGAFWLPHAPLRGAFGVLDRRFAGRCQGLSSMRRTATLEVQMTTLHIHPHAAFDRFPMLVESVKEEFGTDGLMSNVERFIEAERADFHWDGRLAEMNLGAYESLDDEDEAFEAVAIIGYFRSRYYVATCVVDAERHVRWMLRLRHFDSFESAEQAFMAGGD
jgi:hypothetical protein